MAAMSSASANSWLERSGFESIHSTKGHFALTPLMEAARLGAINMVNYLLNVSDAAHGSGGILDASDARCRTALMYAAEEGHLSTIRALLASGASLATVDRNGASPLRLAAARGHLRACECLAGAWPPLLTQPNKHGASPLQAACIEGHLDVAHFLVLAGGLCGPDGHVTAAKVRATPFNNISSQRMELGLRYRPSFIRTWINDKHTLYPFFASRTLFTLLTSFVYICTSIAQVKRETQGLLSTDARAGLFTRIVDDLAAHAAFAAAVLPTASGVLSTAAAARKIASERQAAVTSLASPLPARLQHMTSPLAKLGGVAELLQLVAAFAGVPTGRRLRNAREFEALVRPLLHGKDENVDSDTVASASANKGCEPGATTSHNSRSVSSSSSSTASMVSDENARPIVRRRVFCSDEPTPEPTSEPIPCVEGLTTQPPSQVTTTNDRRRRSTRISGGPTSLWVTPYVATPDAIAGTKSHTSSRGASHTSSTGIGTPVAGKSADRDRTHDLDSATPASSTKASEPSPSLTPTSLTLTDLACAGSDGSSGSWSSWSNKKRKNRAWACASPL
jgi:ankyrin repeat protein